MGQSFGRYKRYVELLASEMRRLLTTSCSSMPYAVFEVKTPVVEYRLVFEAAFSAVSIWPFAQL